jgi:pyruvate kinase
MMVRIAGATEASSRYRELLDATNRLRRPDGASHSSLAIAHAARAIAVTTEVQAIVAFTQSGHTARLVSKDRPPVPIFALTPSEEVSRRVELYWGVTPIMCPHFEHLNELDAFVRQVLPQFGLDKGTKVAMTGGHPLRQYGPTNFLKILEL